MIKSGCSCTHEYVVRIKAFALAFFLNQPFEVNSILVCVCVVHSYIVLNQNKRETLTVNKVPKEKKIILN